LSFSAFPRPILKRREGYRKAFADFEPVEVALFTPKKVAELLKDTGSSGTASRSRRRCGTRS